jgi:hypothetical protein
MLLGNVRKGPDVCRDTPENTSKGSSRLLEQHFKGIATQNIEDLPGHTFNVVESVREVPELYWRSIGGISTPVCRCFCLLHKDEKNPQEKAASNRKHALPVEQRVSA